MQIKHRQITINKILKKLIIICLLLFHGVIFASDSSPGAGPYSISVDFTGQYSEATCTVSINNASNNESISLPTLAVSTLTYNGQEEGKKTFTITLRNCPAINNMVNLYFSDQGGYFDLATGNLTNSLTDGPQQVQIRIRDSNGIQMVINDPDSNQTYQLTQPSSDITHIFSASYFVKNITGLSAGKVSASAQVKLVYK